ncbi:response regulator [Methylocystis bryophila]|uniref:DNA-binding response regulator n=1 Tax=Methylocystis bryophila TaxID=655015 RepID=A0A1W6MZ13_9HYPH|nr:response regulator transcription factor [Methylocystis bryophila]ARN82827.1 DNA-binding response regulator [Methylocystis bryophila]BDV39083.1 DNA-binding response regulator [Methylocystis bryophila]
MRVLIVEDDPILSDGLKAGLGLAGCTIDAVASFADAQAALATSKFDAVVLDLMLPDGSGLDLLRGLRASGDLTPIVLLTALDQVADRVKGLDTGADDYLGKPFDLDELVARVRAAARRGEGRAAPCLKSGGLALDPARLAVTLEGKPISVSRREFAVLSALAERPGVIRSKTELEERLYGWQEEVESNAIEVHIHNLRTKIGRDAIETVRGLGYRLRVSR